MFGIIVDDLLPSQKNLECIAIANQYQAHLFTKNFTKTCKQIDTILMDISEIWDYHSLLIATSLDTYRFLKRSVNASTKIFYVYDPNDLKQSDHEEIVDIDMPMYARSELHTGKLFQITGKKTDVMNWSAVTEKWRSQ
jgi:hypothetical protein